MNFLACEPGRKVVSRMKRTKSMCGYLSNLPFSALLAVSPVWCWLLRPETKKGKRKKSKKEEKKKTKKKREKKKRKKKNCLPCYCSCVLRDYLCLTPAMDCAHMDDHRACRVTSVNTLSTTTKKD